VGANGYVLKTADAAQIVAAVRAVYHGYAALDASVAATAYQLNANARHGTFDDALTEREDEILRLAAQGLTNRGIAAQLGIRDRTVQNHLANIYSKLAVGSRTEAVTKALQLGLIQLPERDE
jgi:DNA-binding NarL/FixJ family response regulator